MSRFFVLLCLLMVGTSSFSTNRALLIGLGKQEDSRWGKIHGDNDIHYVRKKLQVANYIDVRILKNEQATKAAIVEAFNELARNCRKGDAVYIHYSGHGQLMTDLNGDEAERWDGRHAQWDESWIPYDAYMTYCKEDRGEKHLCDDELAELLTKIRNKIGRLGKLTVVVDACHSGDATCGEDEECVRGVDLKFNIPKNPKAERGKPLPERWQTISACKPFQLCTEMKGLKIGKLTYALWSMGAGFFKMDNPELEKRLNEFMQKQSSRLPQNPMVTGSK